MERVWRQTTRLPAIRMKNNFKVRSSQCHEALLGGDILWMREIVVLIANI